MDSYTFLRTIPENLMTGVRSGQYKVCGNLIKNTTDGMKTVGQLVATTPQAGQSIGNLAPALLSATTALSGANLLVSIAGFKMLSNQLKQIGESIEGLHYDIRRLLEGQEDISNKLDDHRKARLEASLRAIERALSSENLTALLGAVETSDEMGRFYRLVVERMLQNTEAVYNHSDVFKQTLCYAAVAEIAIAQSLALCGETTQAVDQLNDFDTWLEQMEQKFRKPFSGSTTASWLKTLSNEKTKVCCEFINWLADVRVGVITLRQQYQFCLEAGMTVRELTEKSSEEGLVVILKSDSGLLED